MTQEEQANRIVSLKAMLQEAINEGDAFRADSIRGEIDAIDTRHDAWLDATAALRILQDLETYRLDMSENATPDNSVRVCQAIVGMAAGFTDRNEWSGPNEGQVQDRRLTWAQKPTYQYRAGTVQHCSVQKP